MTNEAHEVDLWQLEIWADVTTCSEAELLAFTREVLNLLGQSPALAKPVELTKLTREAFEAKGKTEDFFYVTEASPLHPGPGFCFSLTIVQQKPLLWRELVDFFEHYHGPARKVAYRSHKDYWVA